jgi:hypothetical protein
MAFPKFPLATCCEPPAVKAGTAMGLAAKKVMDAGGLVGDDIIIGLGQGAHCPARLRARLFV